MLNFFCALICLKIRLLLGGRTGVRPYIVGVLFSMQNLIIFLLLLVFVCPSVPKFSIMH